MPGPYALLTMSDPGASVSVAVKARVFDLLVKVLERAGYVVLAAATPKMTLVVARDDPQPIDLLITDIVMPQMNGFALAQCVAKLHPAAVLYMSGYVDDSSLSGGVLEKGINFLPKPAPPARVLEMVALILNPRS